VLERDAENPKPVRRPEMKPHTAKKPFVVVKDEKGNQYLCPKEELVTTEGMSDEEIQHACIDESDKPWND
jgi:hypothetical protein